MVEKLVAAANASAAWYERFPEHMALTPWDLAHSYIRRTGPRQMTTGLPNWRRGSWPPMPSETQAE